MSIQSLEQALNESPAKPKGIKVGSSLWMQLLTNGRIALARGYIEGVLDSGIDLPVINENIFVQVDPQLPPDEFRLPPCQ